MIIYRNINDWGDQAGYAGNDSAFTGHSRGTHPIGAGGRGRGRGVVQWKVTKTGDMSGGNWLAPSDCQPASDFWTSISTLLIFFYNLQWDGILSKIENPENPKWPAGICHLGGSAIFRECALYIPIRHARVSLALGGTGSLSEHHWRDARTALRF